jgi:hypothetical protein
MQKYTVIWSLDSYYYETRETLKTVVEAPEASNRTDLEWARLAFAANHVENYPDHEIEWDGFEEDNWDLYAVVIGDEIVVY